MIILGLRGRITQEITEFELFNMRMPDENGDLVPTYIVEGFDEEKMGNESSVWITYQQDAVKTFYQQNKKRIDDNVDDTLRCALYDREKEY